MHPHHPHTPAVVAAATFAFVTGLVALGAGLGIALPHLVKEGFTAPTVAGLVYLVAAYVLLFGGGWVLVRRLGGWRGGLLIPVLLLATFVAAWSLGQAVAATHVPEVQVGDTDPGDLGLEFRDVGFETADGVRLSGWYIPSQNGAAVVMLHGAGSTRSGVLDQADVLAQNGYGVLLFDARGHGRSTGRAMDFGWYGDEDTAAAVTFLQAQPEVDDRRIGAVGLSMGGEEALGAAAADGRIRAVVAEGAMNRMTADEAWLSDEYGWRGAAQERLEWLLYHQVDLLTPADPPISLRAAVEEIAPNPVLLITGGAEPDEGHAGRYIAGGSPSTVELWEVPEAGHTEGLDTAAEEWEARVIAFLDEGLPA